MIGLMTKGWAVFKLQISLNEDLVEEGVFMSCANEWSRKHFVFCFLFWRAFSKYHVFDKLSKLCFWTFFLADFVSKYMVWWVLFTEIFKHVYAIIWVKQQCILSAAMLLANHYNLVVYSVQVKFSESSSVRFLSSIDIILRFTKFFSVLTILQVMLLFVNVCKYFGAHKFLVRKKKKK